MELLETRIGGRTVFDGIVIRVDVDEVELPNGVRSKREIVQHRGGVCVAPVTDDGCLLFVRQFRYAYGKPILELPAGKLEKDENPDDAIVRELKEEVGAVGRMTKITELYPSPGYTNEIIHLYRADTLSFGETHFDEDENLELVKIPLKTAREMVKNGEINDAKTAMLILLITEDEA